MKTTIIFLTFLLMSKLLFSQSERRQNVKIKLLQPRENTFSISKDSNNNSFDISFYIVNNSDSEIILGSPHSYISRSPYRLKLGEYKMQGVLYPSCAPNFNEKQMLTIQSGEARKLSYYINSLNSTFLDNPGMYDIALKYDFVLVEKNEAGEHIGHPLIWNCPFNLARQLTPIRTAWSNSIRIYITE